MNLAKAGTRFATFSVFRFPRTPYPKVNTTGDFVSRFPGKR